VGPIKGDAIEPAESLSQADDPANVFAPSEQGIITLPSSVYLDAALVRTSLGGVLFLINLMLYLDLPEVHPDLEATLGPWGTLEALGMGLLDTLPEANQAWPRWRRDPLWPQLAHLAGRDPHQRLGKSLNRPQRFELPPSWLEPAAVAPQLHRFTASTVRRLSPGLRYWLSRVLPYLRLRIAGAMGAAAAETDDALRELLLREGRLYVSSGHIDLVMSLAGVSVPARIAGLDRDPGWQPRFGRVIKFHFE
jgi:hypothetical protein